MSTPSTASNCCSGEGVEAFEGDGAVGARADRWRRGARVRLRGRRDRRGAARRAGARGGLEIDNGIVVDEQLRTSAPDVFAAGDVANAWHPFYGRRIRVEHWANALNQGPAAARAMLGEPVSYDRIPYFFSDQYDVGMEYSGYATEWDEVVFRGDREGGEFVAFWLRDGRVVAGMNVNVWDVNEHVQALIRSRQPVDVGRADAIPIRRSTRSSASLTGGTGGSTDGTQSQSEAAARGGSLDLARHALAPAAQSGEFAELIRDYSVTGATSNPTIFARAITGSDLYDGSSARLAAGGERDARELFFSLALDDVREAARELRPIFDQSGGRDGFISFECTPDLADDTEATIAQAIDLWQRLGRPNVMIKVPGTAAGLDAIEELTRRGVNVNVTLLFSIERYEQVIDAYLRGLTERAKRRPAARRHPLGGLVLPLADRQQGRLPLPEVSRLRGPVALASARVAYGRYLAKFAGPDWERLERLGARVQRPLWASTGTKNPDYSDVLYVSELIGPEVVNTMPDHTLRAFADHGEVEPRSRPIRRRRADPRRRNGGGIDLDGVTAELEREGVRSFCDSYRQLLDCIEGKLAVVGAPGGSYGG